MCDTADADAAASAPDGSKHKRTLTRLRRISGQVDGIVRMIEEERYCIDILNQVAAVQAALGKVGAEVLERHLETCVVEAVESGKDDERHRVVAELMALLTKSSSLLR